MVDVCFRQRYGNADPAYFMFFGLAFKGRAAVTACFALLAGYYFVWGGNLLRRRARDEIASYLFRYDDKLLPRRVKGDWVYILEPLGLLNYDVIIGHILMYMAVFFLLIAVWSVWYYWTHYEQYLSHTP